LGGGLVRAVMEDRGRAPVSAKVRAMLDYLELVTVRPDAVDANAARSLLDSGVSEEAAREALYVCFLFNVVNRFMDAFGFGPATPSQARRIGAMIRWFGYKVSKLPG